MRKFALLLVPLAVVLVTATAFAQPDYGAAPTPTVTSRQDAKLGTILTDAKGRTLYRFTKDTKPGESACYDTCAQAWPPLTVADTPVLAVGIPGTLATITRTDGAKQVTYNGMPLYYYAKDDDPGDTYGQGVGNVWFVVTPKAGGTPAASPAASPGASPVAGTTAVLVRQDATLGAFLTDAQGRTLYLFTKDTTPGQSACYDKCAQAWPPFTAAEPLTLPAGVPGTLSTITRTDGSKQVTYNGIPLYYYAKDQKAGDTTGQGVGNVWYVVTPAAAGTPAA